MEKMKINTILIIVIGLLFIGCVLVLRDLQIPKEELPKVNIINETYNPPQIHGRPINKNYSTVMTKKPLNLNT